MGGGWGGNEGGMGAGIGGELWRKFRAAVPRAQNNVPGAAGAQVGDLGKEATITLLKYYWYR